jgi:penicillin-binding protein 2
MMRVHKRKIKNGDVANMAIGQGDILISPLQMAQAMGAISQGGRFHQTRLVKQIQSIDNKVIAAYPDRLREEIPVTPEIDGLMRKALVAVTTDGQGTAHSAQVKGIKVAGKTGTAQWGLRTAAWFTGFVPADNPQYSFAALYEGEPNDNTVHGGSHAAPIIGKLLKQIFTPAKTGSGDSKNDATEKPLPADESN